MSQDIMELHANGMWRAASQIVALKVDPKLNRKLREAVIAEAALGLCLERVIEAAPHISPLKVIANLVVLKGRQNGVAHAEIVEAMMAALTDASLAHAEAEAEEAERKAQAREAADRGKHGD